MNLSTEDPKEWTCGVCGIPLEVTKVGFTYMKGNFEVELPACTRCGMVLISEELVNGKMADTERILEDK
jgi:ribosomal protein S27AE